MFEHIRSIAFVAGLLAVAACGGSDSNSGGGGVCTNGTMSSPGTSTDPCAAQSASCATGTVGVAMCTNGAWAACACAPSPTAMTSGGQTGVTTKGCGDGIVQAELGEMCETAAMPFNQCSQLMSGSTGFLMCTKCKYDTTLCTMMPKANTGGSGAATGVGGTGAMTTGGTGARQ